jgi:hypothetical protein
MSASPVPPLPRTDTPSAPYPEPHEVDQDVYA